MASLLSQPPPAPSQPAPPQPPRPQDSPRETADWFIRTMTDDLARLRTGKKPEAKAIAVPKPAPPAAPVKPAEIPPRDTISEPFAPPSPLRPPTIAWEKPRPTAPAVPLPPRKIVPPPAPRGPGRHPPKMLMLLGGIGGTAVILAVLLFVFGERLPRGGQREGGSSPSPTASELVIEGEIVTPRDLVATTTPVITPPSPSPLAPSLPIPADAEEVVTATPENLLSVLAAAALKPRPPATLIHLALPGLSDAETLGALGLTPMLAGATSTPEVFVYFWVQRETFATSSYTHPSRLTVVLKSHASFPAATEGAARDTLFLRRRDLWLGNTPGTQTTPAYQETQYKNQTISYLNFPWPDLTLDHALVAQRNLFLFTTSREGVRALIDRLSL